MKAPETPQEGTAYAVRYGNRDYEVPGAVRTATHTVIPNESIETVTRYIGMGLKLESERSTIQREKAHLNVEREMFQAETGPVMEEVKNLFSLTADPVDESFAEKWLRYGLELRASMPILKERMELSKKRQELEIERRASLPDPEQQAAMLARNATEAATGHLQDFQRHPQFKPLTKGDWEGIQTRVNQNPNVFLRQAGQRLTPDEQAAGVEPGEVYFNYDRLMELVEDRLSTRTELQKEAERANQAIKIATENAARSQRETVPPPPAPTPTVSAPAQPPKGSTTYKSREEWEKAHSPFEE